MLICLIYFTLQSLKSGMTRQKIAQDPDILKKMGQHSKFCSSFMQKCILIGETKDRRDIMKHVQNRSVENLIVGRHKINVVF